MFVWRYLDSEGRNVGTSDRFATRDQADDWLRHSWEDLLDQAIAQVELFDEAKNEALYRMPLTPDE